jgi:hypothetical protein
LGLFGFSFENSDLIMVSKISSVAQSIVIFLSSTLFLAPQTQSSQIDDHGTNRDTVYKVGGGVEAIKAVPSPYPPISKIVESCPPSPPPGAGESEQITLSDVEVDGAYQLAVPDLDQLIMSLKRRTYTGTVDEATSEVLERVRGGWQERGYFKVEVSGNATILSSGPDHETIALSIHVIEGKQYRLGNITFRGNTVFADMKRLRDIFVINDGDLFNREKISQGLIALRKAYGEFGYINFTSVPETNFDEDNRLVYLTVSLDEGKQFSVSGITIRGSDEGLLDAASKKVPFQPGAIYNQRLVELFLVRNASVLNGARDPETPLLKLDERAATVSITFDLRNCRWPASNQ